MIVNTLMTNICRKKGGGIKCRRLFAFACIFRSMTDPLARFHFRFVRVHYAVCTLEHFARASVGVGIEYRHAAGE